VPAAARFARPRTNAAGYALAHVLRAGSGFQRIEFHLSLEPHHTSFQPAAAGRYLIVAWRDYAGVGTTRYQLAVGSQSVGVDYTPPPGISLAATPNPLRRSADLKYSLPASAHTRLDVLDVLGRVVRVLVDGTQLAGPHNVVWDLRSSAGDRVAAGSTGRGSRRERSGGSRG